MFYLFDKDGNQFQNMQFYTFEDAYKVAQDLIQLPHKEGYKIVIEYKEEQDGRETIDNGKLG